MWESSDRWGAPSASLLWMWFGNIFKYYLVHVQLFHERWRICNSIIFLDANGTLGGKRVELTSSDNSQFIGWIAKGRRDSLHARIKRCHLNNNAKLNSRSVAWYACVREYEELERKTQSSHSGWQPEGTDPRAQYGERFDKLDVLTVGLWRHSCKESVQKTCSWARKWKLSCMYWVHDFEILEQEE